jgi:hypothetical protein
MYSKKTNVTYMNMRRSTYYKKQCPSAVSTLVNIRMILHNRRSVTNLEPWIFILFRNKRTWRRLRKLCMYISNIAIRPYPVNDFRSDRLFGVPLRRFLMTYLSLSRIWYPGCLAPFVRSYIRSSWKRFFWPTSRNASIRTTTSRYGVFGIVFLGLIGACGT